ncbi:hypothetical protein ILYODFUR_014234 [Ilyodon furcidens]|uniref:Uncharacterized protein n=1 Tax=Ilyodon furcidens TaxID=33524 RepID=A0ABV0UHD6_9TELE
MCCSFITRVLLCSDITCLKAVLAAQKQTKTLMSPDKIFAVSEGEDFFDFVKKQSLCEKVGGKWEFTCKAFPKQDPTETADVGIKVKSSLCACLWWNASSRF